MSIPTYLREQIRLGPEVTLTYQLPLARLCQALAGIKNSRSPLYRRCDFVGATMDLYFMRHGIAAAGSDPGTRSDRERALTQKGIKRMRKAARGLRALGIPFDRILTSPLKRSRQTADLAAQALKMEDRLEEVQELSPGGSIQELLSRLGAFEGKKHLLLVGHEPLLSETVSFLISGAQKTEMRLKKGGLCCVTVDNLPAKKGALLRWMLTPKQLRLLAGS